MCAHRMSATGLLVLAAMLSLPACGPRAPSEPGAAGPQAGPDGAAATAAPAASAAASAPAAAPAPESAGPAFEKTLALQGIRFRVVARDGRIVVRPEGLERVNDPVEASFAGSVTDAEVADLDADGSPELYVYATGPGDPPKGTVVGWSSNRRRSLSAISIASPDEDPARFAGYRGGDAFTVLEGRLGRRFAVFGDDGKPTGRLRQLEYRLEPGEAGWKLVVDKVTDIDTGG